MPNADVVPNADILTWTLDVVGRPVWQAVTARAPQLAGCVPPDMAGGMGLAQRLWVANTPSTPVGELERSAAAGACGRRWGKFL